MPIGDVVKFNFTTSPIYSKMNTEKCKDGKVHG